MKHYWDIFITSYKNYASYLWQQITNPSWNNYFYWFLGVSALFLVLEIIVPWRKKQGTLRKDFWLDGFYMFFNLFLFSLIIHSAGSDVVVNLFNDIIKKLTGGFDLQKVNPMSDFPMWAVLLIGFVVKDFIQWWIHRLLHTSERLWEFHKVHHSVEEMGFAAHLRFHWMENIVYASLQYIPLALLGIGLYDFFIIHIFTLMWGHFNHSNLSVDGKITGAFIGILLGIIISQSLLDVHILENPSVGVQVLTVILTTLAGAFVLGPIMKKLFNSPEMHIWHHSYYLPKERRNGVNFGLTLAIWDYLFGTAYVPKDGKDIKLGFPGVEDFPKDFIPQITHGFGLHAEEKA